MAPAETCRKSRISQAPVEKWTRCIWPHTLQRSRPGHSGLNITSARPKEISPDASSVRSHSRRASRLPMSSAAMGTSSSGTYLTNAPSVSAGRTPR